MDEKKKKKKEKILPFRASAPFLLLFILIHSKHQPSAYTGDIISPLSPFSYRSNIIFNDLYE